MKTFEFLPGTNFQLGNAGKMTYAGEGKWIIDGLDNEAGFVGFLQNTGSLVRVGEGVEQETYTNNYQINRDQFKFKRDAAGRLLGLDEQVEPGQSEDDFIADLSDEDAEIFGVTERKRMNELRAVEGAKTDEDREKEAKEAAAKAQKSIDERAAKAKLEEKGRLAKDAEDAEAANLASTKAGEDKADSIRAREIGDKLEDMGEVEAAKQATGDERYAFAGKRDPSDVSYDALGID